MLCRPSMPEGLLSLGTDVPPRQRTSGVALQALLHVPFVRLHLA